MISLSTQISSLIDVAQKHIDTLIVPDQEASIEGIAKGLRLLSQKVLEIGDAASISLAEAQGENEASSDSWDVIYTWAETAKQYLILWRDVLFEYQKGLILLQNDHLTLDDLKTLHSETITTLKSATKSLREVSPGAEMYVKSDMEQRAMWEILHNPWPTYKLQFEDLLDQSSSIIQDYMSLSEVTKHSNEIVKKTHQQCEILKRVLIDIAQLIEKAKTFIAEGSNDISKIPQHLESIESHLQTSLNLDGYQSLINHELSDINKVVRVPISVSVGALEYLEINFSRQIRQWLETEIAPGLHDMMELTDRISNRLKMALLNIRNRAIILAKEQELVNSETLIVQLYQPLEQTLEDHVAWEADMKAIDLKLATRLKESFDIRNLYKGEDEFLPVRLHKTLTQFRLDQNDIWIRFKNWYTRQFKALRRLNEFLIKEESLSDSDKIVRYVKSRIIIDDRLQYDSIFKSQGYIGASFCVGREIEMAEIESSIKAWNEGFRGSAVIKGRRHGGKSLMGEWVAHRYFQHNTLAVKPNSEINIDGRKLSTHFNLDEVLDFIKKYSIHKRYLIWIDDIEAWDDVDVSSSQNIRALIRHIDGLSNRLYFLVSMGSWTNHHWDKIYGLNHSFQTIIDLRPISSKEAQDAIVIRHGATHRRLVAANNDEISTAQFGKYVHKVHRLSEGVIGDMLLLWANGTEIGDEDLVTFNAPESFGLPDFLDADIAVLLRAILMKRTTSEYQLRKSFGTSFKDRYSAILQRMISIGIVHRRLSGRIEITSGIVNDVARLLESHGYISITDNH